LGTLEYVDGEGNVADYVVLGVQSRVGDRFSDDDITLARAQLMSHSMLDPTADEVIAFLETRNSATGSNAASAASTAATALIPYTGTATDAYVEPPQARNPLAAPSPAGGVTTPPPTPMRSRADLHQQADQLVQMDVCSDRESALVLLTQHHSVEAVIEAVFNS
jgi:hypothetical protein